MPNGDDRSWPRLIATLNGFRAQYGSWPTRVRISRAVTRLLREHEPSEGALARLLSKVELVAGKKEQYVAEDDEGRVFDYRNMSWDINPDIPAEVWIDPYRTSDER